MLDAKDVAALIVASGNFVEIPTPKTPGIRFVTLRCHDGQ